MADGRKDVPPLKIAYANSRYHGVPYVDGEGKKKTRATVVNKALSWAKFVELLSKLQVIEDKQRTRYFVFAEFGGEPLENGELQRLNGNVKKFYGCVLDIDTPDAPAMEEVKATLDEQGLAYALYTTHSYDPLTPGKENKFRVVVPYDTPLAAADQPLAVMGFAILLGVEATYDECSKVASQPMYWHSAPKERADEAEFYSCVTGTPLVAEEMVALGQLEGGGKVGRTYEVHPSAMRPGDQVSVGSRHNHLAGMLANYRKQGWSREQAMDTVRAVNAAWDEPLPEEQVEGLSRVWDSFERNGEAFGFSHHQQLIVTLDLNERSVYESVLRGIANSADMVSSSERKELFRMIKVRREGCTLKEVENLYKDLSSEAEERQFQNLEELRERVEKILSHDLRDYVWLTEPDKVLCLTDGTETPIRAFKNLVHEHYEACRERVGYAVFDELKLGREYALDAHLIKRASRKGYHPAEEPGSIYTYKDAVYLNRYKRPRGAIKKGDVSPLLEHLEYLVPHEVERMWFISMIAHAVQQPGDLINHMFVIEGGKGIGKSALRELVLEPLFGSSNVQEVTAEMLVDDKKAWVGNAHVDVFEEFKFPTKRQGGSDAVYNFLKKYTTNKDVQRRAMQRDYVEVPNISLKIAFRNPEDHIALQAGDRRYVVVQGPFRKQSAAYYQGLFEWFSDEDNLAAVRWFFHNWKPPLAFPFNPKEALLTAATKELEAINEDWPGCFLEPLLDDPETPFQVENPLMFERDIERLLRFAAPDHYMTKKWGSDKGGGVSKTFISAMLAMGFSYMGPKDGANHNRFRRTLHGVQRWDRVWCMRGVSVERFRRLNRGFDWNDHREDLEDFGEEVKQFIKRAEAAQRAEESEMHDNWDV